MKFWFMYVSFRSINNFYANDYYVQLAFEYCFNLSEKRLAVTGVAAKELIRIRIHYVTREARWPR